MPKSDKRINRNQASLFKKRHYVRIIENTAAICTRLFGYKRKPDIFESQNREGEVMYICRGRGDRYGIFYDYLQFRRRFADCDFETLEALAAFFMAHEMRHYYQMRQIDSKKPRESAKTIEKWRQNEDDPKYPPDDCTVLEFYLQPMEIDAELFAYIFVSSYFDCLVNLSFIDDGYIRELEKYHIELFGESDEVLFPNE